MKLIRVAVLITAESFAVFSVAQDSPSGGAVEGTMVNSVTGAGIGGASVVFFGGQSHRYQATTDAVGHFKITDIAPGSYRTNVREGWFLASSTGSQLFSFRLGA